MDRSETRRGGEDRYRLPQNIAERPGGMVVPNDRGDEVYRIERSMHTLDESILLQSMKGELLCQIGIQAARVSERVPILDARAGILATVVRMKRSPVRDAFLVQTGMQTLWSITGAIAAYDYRIREHSREIAIVSRRWFRMRETYGVEVMAGKPTALVLAVAICLDLTVR